MKETKYNNYLKLLKLRKDPDEWLASQENEPKYVHVFGNLTSEEYGRLIKRHRSREYKLKLLDELILNELEVERKYLTNFKSKEEVVNFADKGCKEITSIYIANTERKSIRVVKDFYPDTNISIYKMTYKESTDDSRVRIEKEHLITEDTFKMFEDFGYPKISKTRYTKTIGAGHYWEIDVFDKYDFIIAEVEMSYVMKDTDFSKDEPWIIMEVTDDPYYLNCNLAR